MKVKCLTCEYLEINQDAEGLIFRCSHGFYDTPEGVLVYHGISGVVNGNVNIWRAVEKCDYKPIAQPRKFIKEEQL